jgi:hypothetical protein
MFVNSKKNLRFWERNPLASSMFEKSLKNPEASQWILILRDFHLRRSCRLFNVVCTGMRGVALLGCSINKFIN